MHSVRVIMMTRTFVGTPLPLDFSWFWDFLLFETFPGYNV
jgi:hypothetical protein